MGERKSEKRSTRRVTYRVPASVRGEPTSSSLAAETRDVSSHGLFFFTDTPIQESSNIEVVLLMPPDVSPFGRQWVCCHATVVRVEQDKGRPGYGIGAKINRVQTVPEL